MNPEHEKQIQEAKERAISALTDYLRYIIRYEVGDDPDHGGPEDAAEIMAGDVVFETGHRIVTMDWRELLG